MKYKYLVEPESAINMWEMEGLREVPFESPIASFDHEDRFRIIGTKAIDMKTIAQIIYPVREAFLKEDFISDAPYVDGEFKELYFPWANRKVDFTDFSHDPKVLSNYVRCNIHSDENKTVELEIITCGGIKLWLNGEVELLYKSYERNVPNGVTFTLDLKEGDNELLVYANDLAERDVFYFFELVNKSGYTLDIFLSLAQSQEKIEQSKKVMESIYFEKDTYISEKVVLRYDQQLLDEDMVILCGNEELPVTLSKDTDIVIIGDAGNPKDLNFGKTASNYFPISTDVDGLKIQTRLYLATYNERLTKIQGSETVKGRKQQALEVAATEANKSDIGTALALLASEGVCSDLCREIIEIHLKRVNDRLDCADFRLPVILLMVQKYPDLLPEDLKEKIKNAALNFRYWCDEPGNDVMWFFSENHALLFHVCQYLSGEIYPDEIFTNSGRDSEAQKVGGRNKIIRWFEEFLPRGYDEWNSLTYLPVDSIAFFTLYEGAPDETIREYAKKALDLTFEIIASNMHHNLFASSYGRTYEHTLKGLELGELSMYAWIAWGQGTVSVKNHGVSLYAISDYEPNAHEQLRALTSGQAITIERVQGGQEAYTYIHKCKDYALASAMKFHPFETGLQQHFINISFSENEIPIWFNHPGERVFSGNNRPSYWAGWQTIPYVEQYENVLMACVKMGDTDEVDYIHANIPLRALDSYEYYNNWFIFEKADAYGAFWFANGYEVTSYGANTNKEIISKGRKNAFVIKCGSKDEFKSYEAFKDVIKRSEVRFEAQDQIIYRDSQHGELKTDLQVGLMKNNEIVPRNADINGIVKIGNA